MINFRIFAASSIGPKYSERGWDCQDSSGTLQFKNIQAIAVADGHGGSDYFRSAIGSKLAIDVLFNQLKNFFEDGVNETERLSDTGIKNFKYDFVQKWRAAVKKDWDDRLSNGKPLGEGEIRYKSVSDKYKARYTDPKVAKNYLYAAYGTTLICAVSTGTQILVLQIGDGTCVLLQRNGEFKVPIPHDEENYLNVTVSLCDKDSELKIRHAILNCDTDLPTSPAAIFLSTDGLDDCFPYYKNEEYLYQIYTDVIIDDMLKSNSNFVFLTSKEIEKKLLPELTRKSSQDDISLAYFVINDYLTLKKSFNKINNRYKSTPTPPPKTSAPVKVSTQTKTAIEPVKNSAESQTKKVPATSTTSTQNVSKPAQVTTPPKTSAPIMKATDDEIKVAPFMNSSPPTPFASNTQKIIRGTYNNAPPVPVGGTPESLKGGIAT